MGEHSDIEWTDHTFNPWWGCTRVGPGCDHCYAERFARRFSVRWGNGQPRKLASDKVWSQPARWNRTRHPDGRPWRVFCASMADVFDNEVDPAWRARLWDVIRATPNIQWQIVTKRIGNVRDMLPSSWGSGWDHVMVIATVVTQAEFDRDVPKLRSLPLARRGLSMEPLIESVDVRSELRGAARPDWIIVGGESGTSARPCEFAWLGLIVHHCVEAGVAVFVKQWGAKPLEFGRPRVLEHRKGGDIQEFPGQIRRREFPIWEPVGDNARRGVA